MKKKLILLFFVSISFYGFTQGHFILQNGKHNKINFKLINNLIVFPVEVNGVELSFLLDTGVSKPIIFNFLNIDEALQINQAERIYLRGLGEGESVEALKSSKNIFRIGDAININQDLYAIFDPSLNFAPSLGVPIHGIIGYDFLRDFVVEINYSKRYMKFSIPEKYKPKRCKGCQTLDIEFFNNKPYIETNVVLNEENIPVKLLMDTGSSDAIWLFPDNLRKIIVPEKYFDDFLGRGLSGRVFGKRAKLESLTIAGFKLKRSNVAFPDSTSISFARKFKERSGSVSGDILKRFNLIFDYSNSKVTFKRNRHFSDPFYYNKSGIVIEHDGVRVVRNVNRDVPITYGTGNQSVAQTQIVFTGSYKYSLAPAFVIVELRPKSPAEKSGLQIGDVLLNINNKQVHEYDMQEIYQMFYGDDGKRIKLTIDRNGVQMRFFFKLEALL